MSEHPDYSIELTSRTQIKQFSLRNIAVRKICELLRRIFGLKGSGIVEGLQESFNSVFVLHEIPNGTCTAGLPWRDLQPRNDPPLSWQ